MDGVLINLVWSVSLACYLLGLWMAAKSMMPPKGGA